MAKVYSLLVRMTPQEKQRMRRVAKERGLPLSTWMRTVALDEAARVNAPPSAGAPRG